MKLALKMAANLNLNLASFRNLKRFFADIFVIDSKDEEEIQKSLGDLPIHINKLGDEKSWIVVFAPSENSERIIKVMRSFGVSSSSNSRRYASESKYRLCTI